MAGKAATPLQRWFGSGAARFDGLIATLIPPPSPDHPARLVEAMRHGVLSGGKRLRPYLVLASARLCGASLPVARRVAAALEFVHCYSLVHDDLPAMDNDDLRRGRPTVHRAFDEATAILAGDGLLTLAFEILAGPEPGLVPVARLRLVAALAGAAGSRGMVGGQMLDLAAEGRFETRRKRPTATDIQRVQDLKTGALITFACRSGALMQARPTTGDLAALTAFGQALGLAFQIRDDLIDHEGDSGTAGKATGKDAQAGKATFVALLGEARARERLAEVSQQGAEALEARFGARAAPLTEVLAFNRDRRL